jgi:hypothetical protein
MSFGWNYPPGVSGNEYQIAGPDYETEREELCIQCKEPTLFEIGYHHDKLLYCSHCGYTGEEMVCTECNGDGFKEYLGYEELFECDNCNSTGKLKLE